MPVFNVFRGGRLTRWPAKYNADNGAMSTREDQRSARLVPKFAPATRRSRSGLIHGSPLLQAVYR